MENETGEKYKIELSVTEMHLLISAIAKKVDWGFDCIDEARQYVELYDKLKETVEKK